MSYNKCIKFDLKKPCVDCPFRQDASVVLSVIRRCEIVESILKHGGPFPCHKTLDYSKGDNPPLDENSQFCAGALLSLQKDDLLMTALYPRLALVTGNFNPYDLDTSSEVVDINEWSK